MKVAVSYLSSNRSILDTIKKINETKADYIHADFMDGKYVKNNNISLKHWFYLRYAAKPLEIHLMVKNPLKYLKYLNGLNIRVVYIHYSAYFLNDITKILKKGYRPGLVINPNDNLELLSKYFKYVDKVLVMGVTPGAGGQKFIPDTLKTLKQINKYKLDNNLVFSVEVDGGINQETATKVSRYCDTVVSGSYVCKELDYNKPISQLKKPKK